MATHLFEFHNGSISTQGNPVSSTVNGRVFIADIPTLVFIPEQYTYRFLYYSSPTLHSSSTLLKSVDNLVGEYTLEDLGAQSICIVVRTSDGSAVDIPVLNADSYWEDNVVIKTITSAQSGNWEDGTTWVGGVVPTDLDEVIIANGHVVTSTITKTRHSITRLRGELVLPTDSNMLIGTSNEEAGTFSFEGGTLSGNGSLIINHGMLQTSGDEWSFVKGAVEISSSGGGETGNVSIDLEKFSFLSTSPFQPLHKPNSLSEPPFPTWRMVDCVFKNASTVVIGAKGNRIGSNILLERCTFIDMPLVETSGTRGYHMAEASIIFDRCVFVGTELRFNASNTDHIVRNSFIDKTFSTIWGGLGCTYDNCFFTNKTTASGLYIFGVNTNQNNFVKNSILYAPQGTADNIRVVGCSNVLDCYIEQYSGGGGNGVLCQIDNDNTVTGNVFVGYGSQITNPLKDGVFNGVIKNNTAFMTHGDFNDNTMMLFERYYPTDGSVVDIKNNLTSTGNINYSITTTNYTLPYTGTIDIAYDYNAKQGAADWYNTDLFVNTASGSGLIADINPQFLDTTRRVDTWSQANIGSNVYEDMLDYFYGLNGYNSTTNTHSNTPLSETILTDMRTWLREGYTPQNMALATAGENGTFIGAISPKSGPVEEKVLSLSASTRVALVDTPYVYALSLTNPVSTSFNTVVTIDGVDRTITIPAESTRVTFNYTGTELGLITASIKSTTAEDVTIVSGPVVVNIVDKLPTITLPSSRWELYKFLLRNRLLRPYHQFGNIYINNFIGNFNE